MKTGLNIYKTVALALLFTYFLASCASRSACQTAMGKKKLNYYNSIQYR